MDTHTTTSARSIAHVRADVPGANGAIARARALGFSHVLLSGDGPALAEASGAARVAGLQAMLDVSVLHLPAAARTDEAALRLFEPVPVPSTDPRHPPQHGAVARAALGSAADAEALASWWGKRLRAGVQPGGGVRIVGLADMPAPAVVPFLSALRAALPGTPLFGWTHGVAWGTLSAIPPGLLDMVASSFPWWDGRGDWFWRELDLLQRIGTVVVPVADDQPQRAAIAAALGGAWMAAVTEGSGEQLRVPAYPAPRSPATVLSAPGQAAVALVRPDAADMRQATRAHLTLLNTDPSAPATLDPAAVLPRLGRDLGPFAPLGGGVMDPGRPITLQPGTVLHFEASAPPPLPAPPLDAKAAAAAAAAPRLAIEAPSPCVDGGRFPARRVVGSTVDVEADIIGDGHDKLGAALRWQEPGSDAWREVRMRPLGNDRWTASFPLRALGHHRYVIEAWRDSYATFADELTKKHAAGVPIRLELQEGAELVAHTAKAAGKAFTDRFAALAKALSAPSEDARRLALLSADTAALMMEADPRAFATRMERPAVVQAERSGAAFASWYEVFPRSLSDDPARHGTFADVQRHLPRIRGMGFDVLYFPPFHPIGRQNRKGRNNTLTPAPDDPGSPYAIGSADGGHDALHPELGTLDDFQRLREACAEHGLELAMDFAIQCSPDHPWLQQHKDWFTWRPDGTIRYAENPPKKYEDIVNVDFYAAGAVPGLWLALCDAVLHWAKQGVRLFRVDNPHTKPLPFWEWMIAEVQARYPDAVFLAEAFTRPKVMYRLAKVGFSQSYTYFTWRETKAEFQEYLTELTQGPAREFFRPHFFVNTPDINPVYLQGAGRPAYLVRAALAATLSGLWGVYNGFELCEGTPVPGKEEYLDSEKYQLRAWDWNRPGNIVPEITTLNAIRRANPALHSHHGLTFLPESGSNVLWFEKATPNRDNVVLVAISMDPGSLQYVECEVPFWRFKPKPAVLAVTDLLTGAAGQWRDRTLRLTLPPDRPYAAWRIEPLT